MIHKIIVRPQPDSIIARLRTLGVKNRHEPIFSVDDVSREKRGKRERDPIYRFHKDDKKRN